MSYPQRLDVLSLAAIGFPFAKVVKVPMYTRDIVQSINLTSTVAHTKSLGLLLS